MSNVKAVIRLDVPDWQIGQEVTVFFPDTMVKKALCEQAEYRVETQQLIDHIKTATDVDDWAKVMVEERLTEYEKINQMMQLIAGYLPRYRKE